MIFRNLKSISRPFLKDDFEMLLLPTPIFAPLLAHDFFSTEDDFFPLKFKGMLRKTVDPRTVLHTVGL